MKILQQVKDNQQPFGGTEDICCFLTFSGYSFNT